MLFDEDFIENIHNDPIDSIIKIIDRTRANLDLSELSTVWNKSEHDVLLTGFALLESVIENFNIQISIQLPILSGVMIEDCSAINTFLIDVKHEIGPHVAKLAHIQLKEKFSNSLNQAFQYEFSQGDLDRVQTLINELREHIAKSNHFDSKHKQRLLSRLEKLQAEMHKKMSDLDKFWGLIGDAGVVLGKFGEDSKPFVDRIKEIADITWRTQSRAEELPSGTPPPKLLSE